MFFACGGRSEASKRLSSFDPMAQGGRVLLLLSLAALLRCFWSRSEAFVGARSQGAEMKSEHLRHVEPESKDVSVRKARQGSCSARGKEGKIK